MHYAWLTFSKIECWFQNFGRVKENPIQSARWLRVMRRSELCRKTRKPIWGRRADQRWLCVPPTSWKCEGNNSISGLVIILFPASLQNRGAAHRVAAYKIWQSLGCHTLTLDYRWYAHNDQVKDCVRTNWLIRGQDVDALTNQKPGYTPFDW